MHAITLFTKKWEQSILLQMSFMLILFNFERNFAPIDSSPLNINHCKYCFWCVNKEVFKKVSSNMIKYTKSTASFVVFKRFSKRVREPNLVELVNFLQNLQIFFSPGVISLRRKTTPGHYSAGVIILLYTDSHSIENHLFDWNVKLFNRIF